MSAFEAPPTPQQIALAKIAEALLHLAPAAKAVPFQSGDSLHRQTDDATFSAVSWLVAVTLKAPWPEPLTGITSEKQLYEHIASILSKAESGAAKMTTIMSEAQDPSAPKVKWLLDLICYTANWVNALRWDYYEPA